MDFERNASIMAAPSGSRLAVWTMNKTDLIDNDSSSDSEARASSRSPQSGGLVQVVNPVHFAVMSLEKQVEAMRPPYRFLLSNLPYKANKKNKVGPVLCDRLEEWGRYTFHVLYKGKSHTGKCFAETADKQAALDLIRLHGRNIAGRLITISIASMKPGLNSSKKPAGSSQLV